MNAIEAISLTESKRFIALEKTIAAGEQTFVDVGNALAQIRNERLYRADHSTFEDYCHSKWGWSRQRSNQLIAAAAIVADLPADLTTIVVNEGSARELAKAPKGKRAEVLASVASKGKVTAKAIAATIKPQTREPAPQSSGRDVSPKQAEAILNAMVRELTPVEVEAKRELDIASENIKEMQRQISARQPDPEAARETAFHFTVAGKALKYLEREARENPTRA